jgi:formyl-CoA transferase
MAAPEVSATRETHSADALPLEGIRILELANIVAGPSVGKHLSDFGAEVIKVERPGEGDTARAMGDTMGSRSAWWLGIGRNKRSVTLDLRSARGRDALLRLVAVADAVVESYRPGVLERLELGPDALRSVNERLIVVRVSAFGQTGPYSARPGFGTLAEAFSGLAAISGYEDRPPLLAPFALADEVAGLYATWALLAALYYRDARDGVGQTIDVSLFESLFSILGPLPTLHHHNGYLPERNGSRLSFSSPRNVYRTRDGQYFAVSGTAPSSAETILRLIGGDTLLADERFATHEARAANADALDGVVAAWIAQRNADEVDRLFGECGAAGMRVMTLGEIAADPHYRARETLAFVHDDELGEVAIPAPVPRMSGTPGRVLHVGTHLGEQTDDVLRELGFTDEEIATGHEEGAW